MVGGGGTLKTRPLLNVSSNLGTLLNMAANVKRVKTAKNHSSAHQKIEFKDGRNGSLNNRHTVVVRKQLSNHGPQVLSSYHQHTKSKS